MEKVEEVAKAFDAWVREDSEGLEVVFYLSDKDLFERVVDQKQRELKLLVYGDLLVLTGQVAVMGLCRETEKSSLEALRGSSSTYVAICLDENPAADYDEGLEDEQIKTIERMVVRVPVQVSLA